MSEKTGPSPKEQVRSKVRAAKRYEILDKYRSQPCKDCDRYFPWYVMEFDHRDGTEKVDSVGNMAAKKLPIDQILLEISKCDVVCASCHKARTYKRGQNRGAKS